MDVGEKVSPLVDAGEMAKALGVSKWQVWEMAKADSLPIPTIRVGKRSYRWSRVALERLLRGETPERIRAEG